MTQQEYDAHNQNGAQQNGAHQYQDPNQPGWAWEATAGRWVPQYGQPPPPMPLPIQPAVMPIQSSPLPIPPLPIPAPAQGGPHPPPPAAASQIWTPEQQAFAAQQWQAQQQYAAQYQQWQANYAEAAAPRIQGATVGMHLKRAIDWNVSDVVLSPREKSLLDAAGVTEPRMQALMAWRRSTMLVALPILVLGVILSFIDAGTHDDGLPRTDLGKLVDFLPPIALALVPLGALIVIKRWTELRRSSRALIVCWSLSILIPLLVALIPVSAVIDFGAAQANGLANGASMTDIESTLFGFKVIFAVKYALTVLPVIVTVPGGVLKGAGRVKFLFPAAALPGWFLVAVAPFYSIFLIVVFILIDQIVGNGLLVVGVGLLAFAPLVFVIKRRVYGRPMSIAEARVELPKAGRLGGYVTFVGFACIVTFLLSAHVFQDVKVVGSDSNSSVFSYVQVGRTALEVFGRNLATAVVFCMIFLSMVFAEWRGIHDIRPDIRAEHDMEMQALRRYTEGAVPPA